MCLLYFSLCGQGLSDLTDTAVACCFDPTKGGAGGGGGDALRAMLSACVADVSGTGGSATFDVGSDVLSLHWPVHRLAGRLVAGLLERGEALPALAEAATDAAAVGRAWLSRSLRCLAWHGQGVAGLWRRSGSPLLNQTLNYGAPPLCRGFRNADICVLQSSSLLLGPGALVRAVAEVTGIAAIFGADAASVPAVSGVTGKTTADPAPPDPAAVSIVAGEFFSIAIKSQNFIKMSSVLCVFWTQPVNIRTKHYRPHVLSCPWLTHSAKKP